MDIYTKEGFIRVCPRIFIFSPNIRFEEQSRASTSNHLIEFIQLDLEVMDAKREDILELIEKMIVDAFRNLDEKFGKVLRVMNAKFSIPEIPFKHVKYLDVYRMYCNDFDSILSRKATQPFCLIDIPTGKISVVTTTQTVDLGIVYKSVVIKELIEEFLKDQGGI